MSEIVFTYGCLYLYKIRLSCIIVFVFADKIIEKSEMFSRWPYGYKTRYI